MEISQIVVLKKAGGDLRTLLIKLELIKFADSFPIPNVETVLHALAGTKYFTKIDLKSAYNQILTDKKFKEVTTINTIQL